MYLTNTILEDTYEAVNSITAENNVTVTGTATLKAGNTIILKPGFHIDYGSNFTAKIETVPNTAKRFYNLKDHLGSIRVVVNETGEIVSSDAGVYPALGGNPCGMILNGRSTNTAYTNAKYKFTSKERDVETGYDYFACLPKSERRRKGARHYDSRIGRWLQVDPLAEKYFGWSPYNYTLNNPIKFVDPNGSEIWIITQRNSNGDATEYVQYKEGNLFNSDGTKYKGNNLFALKVKQTINNLLKLNNSELTEMIKTLENSTNKHWAEFDEFFPENDRVTSTDGVRSNRGEQTGSHLALGLLGGPIENNLPSTPESTLAHELSHSYDFDQGNLKGYFDQRNVPHHKRSSEQRAVYYENIVRNKMGLDPRKTYGGKKINATK